jgi:hypothetical protein
MAAKKYYAWTNIKANKKIHACGVEVTQAKLGITDEAWKELVETKAVRQIPYPVPSSPNAISPVVHFKRLARLIEDGADDPSLLQAVLPPLQDELPEPDEVAAA